MSRITRGDGRARGVSRTLSTLGLSGTAALLAVAGGASWYYANRITEPPDTQWPPAPRPEDHARVVRAPRRTGLGARDVEVVSLAGRDVARRGVWGLTWDGGYGQVADVLTRGAEQAERVLVTFTGRLEGGEPALLDGYAYPPDPHVLGLPVTDVAVESPVGSLPAWRFDPPAGATRRDTWAVLVHGRSARRHEAFRALPTVTGAGLPALVISYRNDPDAPPSPDGRSHLGATEWEDVEAAVRHCLDAGARDVVLVGYSMGGACVANLVRLSPLVDRVRATVLEAPVLDWGPVIRRAAVERGLPAQVLPLLLPATMALAGARARIDWRALRHLDDPQAYATPTLLIHGDADPTVPVELADALAATRADVVRYLRVPGAGHVRAWNTDPDLYASTLRDFLTDVL